MVRYGSMSSSYPEYKSKLIPYGYYNNQLLFLYGKAYANNSSSSSDYVLTYAYDSSLTQKSWNNSLYHGYSFIAGLAKTWLSSSTDVDSASITSFSSGYSSGTTMYYGKGHSPGSGGGSYSTLVSLCPYWNVTYRPILKNMSTLKMVIPSNTLNSFEVLSASLVSNTYTPNSQTSYSVSGTIKCYDWCPDSDSFIVVVGNNLLRYDCTSGCDYNCTSSSNLSSFSISPISCKALTDVLILLVYVKDSHITYGIYDLSSDDLVTEADSEINGSISNAKITLLGDYILCTFIETNNKTLCVQSLKLNIVE